MKERCLLAALVLINERLLHRRIMSGLTAQTSPSQSLDLAIMSQLTHNCGCTTPSKSLSTITFSIMSYIHNIMHSISIKHEQCVNYETSISTYV